MKKITKNVLITILAFFCIFSLAGTNVHAADTSISGIFSGADDFIHKGQTGTKPTISTDTIHAMSDMLYNALLIIGIVLAVIIGLFIGIKLMTGSIEEKAKTKETLIAYVAGCVVVFGAFTIWKIVVTILQSAPTA